VVRRLVAELCLLIEIIGVPTVRERDGLAMSSRNRYLTPDERAQAPALYRSLQWVSERLIAGVRDFDSLARQAMGLLMESGFHPEYVSIRRAEDLAVPQEIDSELIILAAAILGKARLIDNLAVTLKDQR